MNKTLFQSRHGILAVLIVLGFFAYSLVRGIPFGRGVDSERGFLLVTGWTSLTLLVLVAAYVLRKYVHRGVYSPERALKVAHSALERAENDIHGLRQQISTGALSTHEMIAAEAAAILKRAGVQRVSRAVVEPGPAGGDPWTVRIVPTEPLGRMARWMHVHVFYGAAFGAVLLMHSGFLPRSNFGLVLAGLGYLVFVTGLVGIFLWARGPRWLTAREHDLSIEEANALHASLGRKRADAVAAFQPQVAEQLNQLAARSKPTESQLRTTLQDLGGQMPEREAEIQDTVALISQERAVGLELVALKRVRASFMAWRIIHIPVAVLLSVLVAVHVVSIWKF
jgi:hypothetical protein